MWVKKIMNDLRIIKSQIVIRTSQFCLGDHDANTYKYKWKTNRIQSIYTKKKKKKGKWKHYLPSAEISKPLKRDINGFICFVQISTFHKTIYVYLILKLKFIFTDWFILLYYIIFIILFLVPTVYGTILTSAPLTHQNHWLTLH